MSQPGYANPIPVHVVAERLREAVADRHHEFWPDALSLLDERAIDTSRVHGPRQLTDVYLLGLAVARGGRLVTFDRSLPVDAVLKAEKRHLAVI
jgi:predicted nucleic acid-binding protein